MKTKAIEGGEEKYAQESNWSIIAFPHYDDKNNLIPYTDWNLDGITDYNNLDKYRFLYLWRKYSVYGAWGYKIRLY